MPLHPCYSFSSLSPLSSSFFFFFNDTATTEIYTLSLHDALPISVLDADAEADHLGPHPGLALLLGRHLSMGGRGGVAREGFCVAPVDEALDEAQRVVGHPARFRNSPYSESHDGASVGAQVAVGQRA